MTDNVKELCDLRKRIAAAAEICDSHDLESVGGELGEIGRVLDKMVVDLSISLDALGPVFAAKGGIGATGELDLMDLCYNAFMIGRRGAPQDMESDRCDWMNDTRPLMRAGLNDIHKAVIRRMEYAKALADKNRIRMVELENERHEALN